MYWISTHHQLADEASRQIGWNEEYIPQSMFDELTSGLNVRPDLDVFASEANKKCLEWINLGINSSKHCLGYDFFCMNPNVLKNRILYAFPPKNIVNQAIYHLAKYYKNHRVILLIHIFQEWPAAFPKLVQIGATIKEYTNIQGIVPAEFQLKYNGEMHYGFWNNRAKKMALIHWNL